MAPKKVGQATPPVLAPPIDTMTSTSSSKTSLDTDPLPVVHINKANLLEMKIALDDIVKKYMSEISFTPSLLHPTVHLSLGYSSVIVSLAGVLYSLKVDFETSRPVLWVSVVGYMVFQSLLWAWKKYVEKGEVYRGKRRRMVKRIETDHVQIISSTSLDPPSPPVLSLSPLTRPSSPHSAPGSPGTKSSPTLPPSSTSSKTPPAIASDAPLASASSGVKGATGPSYVLALDLSTTSNNGKSLIHKATISGGRGVGEFIDENGGVEEGEVKRWLGDLLKDAGLVGAEDAGMKTE